jgi:hypothetical protein
MPYQSFMHIFNGIKRGLVAVETDAHTINAIALSKSHHGASPADSFAAAIFNRAPNHIA